MAGIDGFLGTRATFMLDVIALVMFAVLPLLAWSVALVKYFHDYAMHKKIQLTLCSVLLGIVVLFEIDMRVNGWRDRAAASPYVDQGGTTDWVLMALSVHLCFAVTTALLWATVMVQALRHFPNPPAPNAHSAWHRRFGQLAALDMLCTCVTGWIFYWLAFVA